MKKLYTLTFVVLFFIEVRAQWGYVGLGITQVSDLTVYNDTMYASTYDGIYKHGTSSWFNGSYDTTWIPVAFQGRHVVQSIVVNHSTLISLVEIDSTYTTQIYKSTDYGNSFTLMNPDTSDAAAYMYLDHMAHSPASHDTLYFLDHHLKTYDGGQTWDTIHNLTLNDRFIWVDPNSYDLIIGGETFMFSGYVQTSNDNGDTWNYPAMTGYFAGDNCVHDLDIGFFGEWLAAGEGVICSSTDGGENWTQLLNTWSWPPGFSLYHWDVEAEYLNYVTGGNLMADRVPLLYNHYANSHWDTISTAAIDSQNPNIQCMQVLNGLYSEDVFLGGHGIYVHSFLFADIIEREADFLRIFPNPFNSRLSFRYNKPKTDLTATVFNSFGQVVKEIKLSGQSEDVDCSELSPGLYVIHVEEGGKVVGRYKRLKN